MASVRRRRTIARLTGIVALTATAAVVVTLGVPSTGKSDGNANSDRKPLDECGPILSFNIPEAFKPFKLYALGCGWRGLPLDDVVYRNQVVPPGWYRGPIRSKRLIWLTFLYGRFSELQVQIWPACERTRSSYTNDPPGPINLTLPRENTTIRGVPAAWFEARGRLELYTGRETIVLFRQASISARQLREAAQALSGVNNPIRPGQRLAKPVPGALQGKLRC